MTLRSMLPSGPVIRMVSGKPSEKDPVRLAVQVNAGKVETLITAVHPLDWIVDARRDAESMSGAGKRIVLVR